MSGDHSCGVSAGKRALRGTGPSLAGNVGTGGAFALAREGDYRVSTFLRSLRPGPAPLGVFGGALRGTGPALAGNVGTGGAFALSRGGDLGCRRSYARSGPVPLRLTYLVGRSAGPGQRSQGTWGEVGLSRWRARGGNRVFTFLCSLRSGPAAALGCCITVDAVLCPCAAALGYHRVLGFLEAPCWRGEFRKASLGLQLANQGVAGGEDAFVGGNGFRHRAELGC